METGDAQKEREKNEKSNYLFDCECFEWCYGPKKNEITIIAITT